MLSLVLPWAGQAVCLQTQIVIVTLLGPSARFPTFSFDFDPSLSRVTPPDGIKPSNVATVGQLNSFGGFSV